MSDAGTEGSAAPPATNGGAAAEGDVESLRAALATAEEAARNSRDQYLRALAELENVRKRAQRDIENAHRYALERFAAELLPARDSLELGVASGATGDAKGKGPDVKSLLEGQDATLKLLSRAFDKFLITRLEPLGENFDPTQHEAVLAQESSTAAPNSVLQVLQSGYSLNGRLLRPARVVVVKAPETPANAPSNT